MRTPFAKPSILQVLKDFGTLLTDDEDRDDIPQGRDTGNLVVIHPTTHFGGGVILQMTVSHSEYPLTV